MAKSIFTTRIGTAWSVVLCQSCCVFRVAWCMSTVGLGQTVRRHEYRRTATRARIHVSMIRHLRGNTETVGGKCFGNLSLPVLVLIDGRAAKGWMIVRLIRCHQGIRNDGRQPLGGKGARAWSTFFSSVAPILARLFFFFLPNVPTISLEQ